MTLVVPVGGNPPIGRAEAIALAEAEDARFVAFLRTLGPDDWRQQTDCTRWDVRAMVGHVAGNTKSAASIVRMVRQMAAGARLAKRLGLGEALDGANELQVREHAHLTTDELIDELEAWQPRGRRGRARMPRLVRRLPAATMGLRFPLGQLADVILTRDVWLHRVDIALATGRAMELTPDHDGRLVADVVAEWSRRHGHPFDLVLTGPAGGHYVGGDPDRREHRELDAVEFCRIVSGRASGPGLLSQKVVF